MKNRIFFILPTLHAGGAERVMSFVAQNLDKEKFDATLIVVGFEKDSKFDVTGCPIIFLNKSRVIKGALALSILIAKQKPQIVVSSIAHLNTLMGLISTFLTKPVYVGRQAAISGILRHIYPDTYKKRKSKFSSKIANFGIKQLDHFICQSDDMRKNLMDTYDVDNDLITVIGNPVTQTDIIKIKKSANEVKKYITVGRLSKGKGHIRVLRALSKLTFPFQYTIIGEGTYFNDIVHEVKELRLEERVNFIKYTDSVQNYLVDCDMFLQGSYTEGFPNALLESCAIGVPVIAFNVPGGTKDIVEDGVNGFLVEDEDEYYRQLNNKTVWNPEEIRESVFKKFNKQKIINDYEKLFFRLLNYL